MANKQKWQTKSCSDCIHENACRIWTDGRFISDASASVCTNHETVKESGAYLCGVLDERNRKKTNADRIRAMSDEELADFLAYTWATSARAWQKDSAEMLFWLQQPAEEADNE